MPTPVPPVNPFSVGKLVEPPAAGGASASGTSGGGFERLLGSSLDKLEQAQSDAAQQTQALATGQAQDLSSVVMSVEKASLEVQLATQVRTKVVDAYNDLFRMQI